MLLGPVDPQNMRRDLAHFLVVFDGEATPLGGPYSNGTPEIEPERNYSYKRTPTVNEIGVIYLCIDIIFSRKIHSN